MYDNLEFVICAAGECTRNYPHSKAVAHKTLLPMGDKRIIDYALQEIIRTGGKHITIVCSNQQAVDAFQKALKTNNAVVQKLRDKKQDVIAGIVEETFLPSDIDLKFVIQKEPLGTAHVLYVAKEAIKNRHIVLIFPDDVWLSKNPKNPHMKKLVDTFLKNPKTIQITGWWCKEVCHHAILLNNRIVEKPKNAPSQMAGWDPVVLPNEIIQFVARQASKKIKQVKETKKEWYYIDAVNDFLDQGGEKQGFGINMFAKADQDEMLDTGNLLAYEQALLKMLLTKTKHKAQHKKLARQLLN